MKRYLSLIVLAVLASAASSADNQEDKLRKAIVDTALAFRGVPYVYGAESPSAFDCSGFVKYVYRKAAGIEIPRTSRAQFASGIPVKPEKAQPGDVLVFDTVGGAPSHVAILVDGKTMIHAASDGPSTGVILSPLTDRYFAPRIIGAREFLAATAAPAAAPAAKATEAPPSKAPAETKQPRPEIPADRQTPRPTTKAPPQASVPAPLPAAADEPVVTVVGFSITNTASIFTDKIPAAAGTALQFAVTNATGADGVFEILFYKMDVDPSKNKTLRRDRVSIGAGKMKEVEPFTFTESGQYKLILKTHDNIKRVERIWRVVDVK